MKILVAATALVLAGSLAAVVPAQQAQAQTSSKEQTTKKIKKAKTAKTAKKVVRYRSPYSTNPAHDVYLNGVYVGSDPDPRVRWNIKREACQDQVDGCMDAALR